MRRERRSFGGLSYHNQVTISVLLVILIVPSLTLAQSENNWPQFRGEGARGVADGHALPERWDGPSGANVKWRTPLPGLGHSSPVVWGDKVFLTTAVRDDGEEPFLRVGLYGESPDNPEDVIHHFNLMCLDKNYGKVLWEKTSHSGIPQVMRHIKSSHATCTPSTDGEYVVAFYGSEGLYCYDLDGNLVWEKDLGFLDAGAFDAPEIRWGFGSSAVIFEDRVITLCDVNNQSFIAAFDLDTGEDIWRTLREEVPTWGTPTIVPVGDRYHAVVNGWHRRAAYDTETGEEVWWMDGGGDVPVPTPFVAHGLIFFSSAHGRLRPLYAISLEAKGEITLAQDETSNEFVAWSNLRRGAYIPTPIVYGDHLYVLQNNGALTCYMAETGESFYRERAGGVRGAYSASPVAGDGKVYCTSEFGDIHVIKTGAEYKHLATNVMGEICMATPAISGGMLFIRTQKALYAVADLGHEVEAAASSESDAASVNAPGFTPPAEEQTDPLEILKLADTASRAVQVVQYDIDVEVTGGLTAYYPGGHARITAEGLADGWPDKFVVEVTAQLQGMDEPVTFIGGSDGNLYYLVDPVNKSVHEDFDLGAMGRHVYTILSMVVQEFHVEEPFSDELACEDVTLMGSEEVAGEPCYTVSLDFKDEQEHKETLFISKKSYLPVGRKDTLKLRNGQEGGYAYTITRLVVDPELAKGFYAIAVPDGYERTNDPPR